MVSWERSEMDAGISQTYTEMCFPKSEFGKEGNSENRSLGKRVTARIGVWEREHEVI